MWAVMIGGLLLSVVVTNAWDAAHPPKKALPPAPPIPTAADLGITPAERGESYKRVGEEDT